MFLLSKEEKCHFVAYKQIIANECEAKAKSINEE